jgi:DNA repair exonuclease SbcCD ATPase subunit
LRGALATAGMEFGEENPPKKMLVDLARIWLEEQRETAAQREALVHELSNVESALDRVRQAARARPADELDMAERRERELDQAQGALREAEERLQRHSQAEADLIQRKAELAAAVDAERSAAADLFAAEATEVEAARAEHEYAAEEARVGAELATASEAERESAEALTEVAHLVEQIESADDRTEREATVSDAQAALGRAEAEAAAARNELAQVDQRLEGAATDDDTGPVVTSVAAVEELEWYLLSRLAGQRALSYAGSLPFVLDDALRGVSGDGLTHLLGRLERMSSAVQVVILSDDNEIAAWADAIGSDRAVTLYPATL